MKNQNITIVFLAVILVAGATTIASPILIDDASATGDRKIKNNTLMVMINEREYDSKYSDDSYGQTKTI